MILLMALIFATSFGSDGQEMVNKLRAEHIEFRIAEQDAKDMVGYVGWKRLGEARRLSLTMAALDLDGFKHDFTLKQALRQKNYQMAADRLMTGRYGILDGVGVARISGLMARGTWR